MARLRARKLLEEKGISVRLFSKMIRSDYAALFRQLSPKSNPTLKTMNRWAKALKVKVRDPLEE